MKDFVSFVTYLQPVYFMSTIFLEDNITGVRVPKFQLAYIRDKTHPLHKRLIKLSREAHFTWWVNQEL